MQDLRTRGWEAWETIPLPTLTTEGWRRSDLPLAGAGPRARRRTCRTRRLLDALPPSLLRGTNSVTEAGVLVQQDGHTIFGEISSAVLDQGVLFTDLHGAARAPRFAGEALCAWCRPAGSRACRSNAGKFEALNAALFSGGGFV